ncbi:MAG: NAD(P)-binding domain-containing protein [Burkholderiales bacterium]
MANPIEKWLEKFGKCLERRDIDGAAQLFGEECYWRDLVAFTWTLKTFEGRGEIRAMLSATLGATAPSDFFALAEPTENDEGVVEGWFAFETALGRGTGHLRLRDGGCWTILTTLQELKGFEEPSGPLRERGLEHGVVPGRLSWLERRRKDAAELGFAQQPYVLIVGGGQGGLALAARLKHLQVPTLVVEQHERAGDSWRKRYRSLCLHDPVWYDHMPYLPFPDHWPVFSPKDKMGDWLEMYARVMELSCWTSTKCLKASFDEAAGEWVVQVERSGRALELRPKHLVLATGMSGFPSVPEIPGAEAFAGKIVHSSKFDGGAAWRDKCCVVLGANNSAHDIAADLVEHGAQEVTLVQRSSTVVVTSDALMEHAWGKLYSEDALERGITTEIADLSVASVPFRLLPSLHRPIYETIRERDAALYEGLAGVGFQFDFGEDGSGIHSTYLRRGAGYYIDVGASQMVIDGRIGLKSPAHIERIAEQTVRLSDGSVLTADLVVLATGYGSMNQWAAELISPEVAARVGKCWGLGSDTKYDPGPWEGELRNMWKPTQQPGLWFMGGNLMQARHYSLYLALQLKARYEGLDTPVYYLEPVHHP